MQSILAATMSEQTADGAQRVTPVMHWWFLLDTLFITVAGIQLFILSDFTAQFFAWTIRVPLTAAFLGAAYWSAIPMTVLAFREQVWARARIAVLGVWAFTLITLILTLLNLDKFNQNSPLLTAQLAFWAWLGVYILVPVGLFITWLIQRRAPGGDPARVRLLPNWFRALLAVQAGIMIVVGIALYFASAAMIPVWGWALTPLTSGAVGAWGVGIGITAAHAAWENDWTRLRGNMLAYALLGALELVAVARYVSQVDWTRVGAWLYVVFITSILVVGGVGLYLERKEN